jgi:aminopeptidase YwaD
MEANNLLERAHSHLHKLCVELPTRRVGSPGNRAATDYFASVVSSCSFATEMTAFDCLDWSQKGATLSIGELNFPVLVSPYTLGFHGKGILAAASTVAELEGGDFGDCILLMHSEIAKEQLMPKNFVFYNPDEHKQIIHLLEIQQPRAIIAATTRNTEMAGAVYPFPLIEDGNFDIPSVYTTAEEGQRLLEQVGKVVSLDIRARRVSALGCNVIARRGEDFSHRLVLFAHIDVKENTPGALDNATGCVVLLLLAEMLADYPGRLGVELVALNGEDDYSAAGEMRYLAQNEGRFGEIFLGINLDGVGYRRGKTAYSLYNCPSALAGTVKKAFGNHEEMIEGEAWYQGDHGLFLMNQRPALAITSEYFMEILAEIAHTPRDTLDQVDLTKLVLIASCIKDLILLISQGDV